MKNGKLNDKTRCERHAERNQGYNFLFLENYKINGRKEIKQQTKFVRGSIKDVKNTRSQNHPFEKNKVSYRKGLYTNATQKSSLTFQTFFKVFSRSIILQNANNGAAIHSSFLNKTPLTIYSINSSAQAQK